MQFRESQRVIIEGYEGGLMGISAVPGSGKTFTLSHLAARLVGKVIRDGDEDQEVLIVTFSNSAVNSFKHRIADILQQGRGLMPYVGYRVRTLHGLAHDIVRERPALVGLADDFQIVDERVSASILRDVVNSQIPLHASLIDQYIKDELSEKEQQRVRVRDVPLYLSDIAVRYINHAKDRSISPYVVTEQLKHVEGYALLRFANAVYEEYQRTLGFRGAVDFNDLVVLALRALQLDEEYRQRIQHQFPYVLEDEAQDSSLLQEQMLKLITNEQNWVRVGDPNQAINTTFTSADSNLLRQFLSRQDVIERRLPTSGRCGLPIIDMANRLVEWSVNEHFTKPLRGAFYEQYIEPTQPGDPQQNLPLSACNIYIHYKAGEQVTPEQELDIIAGSMERFLKDNPDKTVAALVPANSRGVKLAEVLAAKDIQYDELLRSTTNARQTAAHLVSILDYLAKPHDARSLAQFYYTVWSPITLKNRQDAPAVESIFNYLRNLKSVEELLAPTYPQDFAAILESIDDLFIKNLEMFIAFANYCLDALSLPIDQLILTISQRLFFDAVDIALSYKIAALLRGIGAENPKFDIPEFVHELRLIVDNQRRFIGFDDASEGYEAKPAVPTIATMHAAKGLEWDRVYLLSISNYDFPTVSPEDNFVSEKWFIRDALNLEAETVAQLNALLINQPYFEGEASQTARIEYSAERLRLLYVAMTRAKQDLMISWNIGAFAKRFGANHLSLNVMPLI